MTETRFYEPARLSNPPAPKFLLSLKPLDATTWLRLLLSKVFPKFYLYKCITYLQINEVKACIANYTITNAPISCVARPTRAVI